MREGKRNTWQGRLWLPLCARITERFPPYGNGRLNPVGVADSEASYPTLFVSGSHEIAVKYVDYVEQG